MGRNKKRKTNPATKMTTLETAENATVPYSEIRYNDVICTKDNGYEEHFANARMKEIMIPLVPLYVWLRQQTGSKNARGFISQYIVDRMTTEYNSRFICIKKEYQGFGRILTKKQKKEKVAHKIREYIQNHFSNAHGYHNMNNDVTIPSNVRENNQPVVAYDSHINNDDVSMLFDNTNATVDDDTKQYDYNNSNNNQHPITLLHDRNVEAKTDDSGMSMCNTQSFAMSINFVNSSTNNVSFNAVDTTPCDDKSSDGNSAYHDTVRDDTVTNNDNTNTVYTDMTNQQNNVNNEQIYASPTTIRTQNYTSSLQNDSMQPSTTSTSSSIDFQQELVSLRIAQKHYYGILIHEHDKQKYNCTSTSSIDFQQQELVSLRIAQKQHFEILIREHNTTVI